MSLSKPTRTQRKKMMRADVLARHGCRCFYCDVGLTEVDVTLDHVVPRCAGGPNTKANQVPACRPCNALKADMDLEEFRAWFFVPGRVRVHRVINEVADQACWGAAERVLLTILRALTSKRPRARFPGELRSSPGFASFTLISNDRREFTYA